MRIRVIRGIYGHSEKGRLTEKNAGSGSFEVSEEEGKRLISLGVAVKVSTEGDDSTEGKIAHAEKTVHTEGYFTREYLEEQKLEELRSLAGENGLKKNGSREDLIERLLELQALDEEEAQDEEELPELSPAEPE